MDRKSCEGTFGNLRRARRRLLGPGQSFFEERFKSVAVLDEESLLATCAYIDLNPVAAGIAEVPEASPHTSVTSRVAHVKAQGRTNDLKEVAARLGVRHLANLGGCPAR